MQPPPPPHADQQHHSILKLQAGNNRYMRKEGKPAEEETGLRRRLSTMGQNPWAIIVGCSDSRCPVERLFDASPGDLFVIRVAGNIVGSPVGGVIGSTEYGVQHLNSPVILVLGHTKCGAVQAALTCCKGGVNAADSLGRNLGAVVTNICPPARDALAAGRPGTPEQLEEAIKLNVYNSMEMMLKWSGTIREAVGRNTVELHGGIYDITTGQVSFLGKHPRQSELLMYASPTTVRTGSDAPMLAPDAMAALIAGNQRYVSGNVESKVVDMKMRSALVQQGQRPHSIILGCADSRISIDHVFDCAPGDLFVVRNAGNISGSLGGGLVGSMEYGVAVLKSRMLVVLGHTKCGAVQAAMEAHLSQKQDGKDVPEGLKALLEHLKAPVKQAVQQSSSMDLATRVEEAIKLNVWHTIESVLQNSPVLLQAVSSGDLHVHGAIYDLATGLVNFMGEHPRYKGGCTSRPTSKQGPSKVQAISVATKDMEAAWVDVPRTIEDNSWNLEDYKPAVMVETRHGQQHLFKEVMLDPNNWRAGLTVAFVSVPLSIALGIASGTTPMRGVSCAIFGGLCSGLFGSSDYNIVGPAGALSGMLMSYVVQWGDDCLPWISLISAAICAIFALLRLDVYMLMMPKSVFEGFTVGVALIIGLNQINFACGLTPDKKYKLFIMNIIESIKTLDETQWPSVVLFFITAPILWFLMRKLPKIPWTVIIPVVSIPLGYFIYKVDVGFDLLTLESKYGVLKPEIVKSISMSKHTASWGDLIIPSFSVAIVAVLETLISAKIAATRLDRSFNELLELRGLIIGHVVCGLTGSMPPTGVFVRTNLNTTLGATHRFAQLLNAGVVALIAGASMPVFSYLPQATIAAILVVAAVRMCPVGYLKQLWAEDKTSFVVCLVTAAICVGEDPVIGLAAGMLLAILMSAKKHLLSPFLDIKDKPLARSQRSYQVILHGALTYINSEMFIEKARKLDGGAEVVLDLSGLRQADHDGICAMGKCIQEWGKENLKITIKGVAQNLYPKLEVFKWFSTLETNGMVVF